jgi:hypothetical protein
MAPFRRQGPAHQRGAAREFARSHRAGDEHRPRPRDGSARTLHDVPRLGRLGRRRSSGCSERCGAS